MQTTPGPRWMICSGQEATVGDEVSLEFHPDEIGIIRGVHPGHGLPIIEVTEGPYKGTVRELVYPHQILMKRGTSAT